MDWVLFHCDGPKPTASKPVPTHLSEPIHSLAMPVMDPDTEPMPATDQELEPMPAMDMKPEPVPKMEPEPTTVSIPKLEPATMPVLESEPVTLHIPKSEPTSWSLPEPEVEEWLGGHRACHLPSAHLQTPSHFAGPDWLDGLSVPDLFHCPSSSTGPTQQPSSFISVVPVQPGFFISTSPAQHPSSFVSAGPAQQPSSFVSSFITAGSV